VEGLLRFLNVFAAGIAAGGMSLTAAANPAKQRLPEPEAAQLHVETSRYADKFLPAAVGVALVAGIIVLITDNNLSHGSRAWLGWGLAANVAVSIPSMAINLPINRRLDEAYRQGTLPTDVRATLLRWSRVHAFRTLFGLLAFAAYLVSFTLD
jgi:hypothetical protein